jgi:NADH-quinone oxidoreductase subunit L
MWFLRNAWLIPLIPAVSFFVILFFGKRLPMKGSDVGIAAVGASLALSVGCAIQWIRLPDHATTAVDRQVTWWQSGGMKIQAGIHIDGLAVMMLFVVSFISFLVHVYSTAYMHGDRRYTFFFAALSLFTASMLTLVVADNLLQLMVGWELVGLCSFMLIGHWWEEKPNSDAALKAFLTTRTGDIGLMIGVIICFFAAHTFNIAVINAKALNGSISHGVLLAAAVTLFLGTMGKSGQFPLHTWLPDAMAGPTPVSALIHAATMVVAGVFLVARVYGVFWAGFSIGHGGANEMAAIGGTTIIIAAALAFVQSDIKKVLAYSTISQLGYMVMGLGVGAWTGAIFHLFTHAFFKALLFLGAGSVSHSGSHHSFDMKKDMGGLRRHMPITFWTFVIGSVALAGIFPLAGFWSKDEILLAAGKNGYTIFMVVGLVGAAMTAAYMTRCVYLTFFGQARGAAAEHHPHESPRAITVPLVTLAVFSVGAGWLNGFGFHGFPRWTANRTLEAAKVPEHAFSYPAAALSLAVALAGVGIGYLWWWRHSPARLHELSERNRLAGALNTFLVRKYYLDDIYERGIIGSIKGPIAQAAYWVNQNVIDAVVNGVGIGAREAAHVVYDVIDQKVVDGMVNGAGFVSEESGGILRYIQTGRVQQYAALLFGAVAVLALVLVLAS